MRLLSRRSPLTAPSIRCILVLFYRKERSSPPSGGRLPEIESMKYCPNCNQPCGDTETFCGNCGANLNAAPAPQSAPNQAPYQGGYAASGPYAAYGAAPRVSTKKEFLNLPENKKVKSEIKTAGIICYICAGITLLASFATNTFPLSLLDVAILVGLGLGIHLAHSRVCAIILTIYAASSMIIGIIQTGRPSGYLVLIAGIFAVIYTFKAEKLWKQYQQV